MPEAATPSDIPDQAPNGHSSLFTADVAPAKLKPGVYARGRHTTETAQAQLGKVTGGARYDTGHNLSSTPCTLITTPA